MNDGNRKRAFDASFAATDRFGRVATTSKHGLPVIICSHTILDQTTSLRSSPPNIATLHENNMKDRASSPAYAEVWGATGKRQQGAPPKDSTPPNARRNGFDAPSEPPWT